MARVNPEKILEHLAPDVRRALEKALRETMPGVAFDAVTVCKAFIREVGRCCAAYEQVPDSCVQQ